MLCRTLIFVLSFILPCAHGYGYVASENHEAYSEYLNGHKLI